MLTSESNYFTLFVSSYLLVGVLTPLMRKIALSKEIMDFPNSAHKSHTQPTPYLGGLAIIIGVITITYCSIFFSGLTANNFWLATSLLGPAIALGLIGLWDDIRQLAPLPRFIGQTIASVFVAIPLILTNNLGNPTGSKILDVIISVVWIVGICNSINFFDNLDGGAAGTSAISSIFLALLAINWNQYLISSLALVLAGSTLGFLMWNKSPARIYMGDSGALFIGVLLATLTIRLNPETDSSILSFSIPILLLAVPILDTCVAVFSRLRRKVSPFQGGKDHLSHRLIRSGITRKNSAISLWALSVFFSLVAVFVSNNFLNLELVLVILAIIIWIFLFYIFLKTKDS